MNLSKRNQKKRTNYSTRTIGCGQHMKSSMKKLVHSEVEYNKHHLYFYCKYFDIKTKGIKVLPNNYAELKNKYLTSIKNN